MRTPKNAGYLFPDGCELVLTVRRIAGAGG